MGKTYERANPKVLKELDGVTEQYHGGLHDAGVTVDVLLAYAACDQNGDPRGPAITDRGTPALATIRVTALKERALGLGDAVMILDGNRIDEWSDAELVAVLDHELSHLELNPEKRDDLDRPKLKTVPHDMTIGGFELVARRHGQDAPEVQQVMNLLGDPERQQMLLPGFDSESESTLSEAAA